MIKAKKFEHKYDCTTQAVTQAIQAHKKKNNGEYPKWAIKQGKEIYVNEEYLLTFTTARKRLWIVAHDYFFFLTYVVGMSQSEIARKISHRTGYEQSNLTTYLSCDLFTAFNEKLLATFVSRYQIALIKYAESVIPHFHRLGLSGKIDGYKKRLKDMK